MNRGKAVVERKLKPDGGVREYQCELLHAGEGLMVVRFEMAEGGATFAPPFAIPPGSWSLGFFWKRRQHNLYRMRGPDGTVLGHRIDALTDVRFDDNGVTYRDLALDWWVLPDDTLIEEDREEFDALVDAGALSAGDAAAVDDASRQVYSRYRHIIDDVAILERKLRLAP